MNLAPWSTTCAVALVLGALAALAGLGLRVRRYRAVFRIAARRDDRLTCRSDHPVLPVTLDEGGFVLPDAATPNGPGSTAFLICQVQATWLGRFVDPFIEVRRGTLVYRQYLERGAAGRRALNLSPIFDGPAGSRVALRGGCITWRPEATLELHHAPIPTDGELLVVAPHPDDAEIAAFGMYASRPARAWIASITAGERGTADLSASGARGAERFQWTASLRTWDSLNVPQLGGVTQERCLNLAYPDGQLAAMHRDAERPFAIACQDDLPRQAIRARNRIAEFAAAGPECTWNGLVAELRRVLEMTAPAIVFCPHPLLDPHPDHVFSTVAVEQAVRGIAVKPACFLLYAVHIRDVPIHPPGPAHGWASTPPWTDAEWMADALHCHPLSPEIRRAKYFAIEAMHDERVYASGETKTIGQLWRTLVGEISAFVGGTAVRPTSFLRRGPRPNEMFYVVSAEGLGELVRRALARTPEGGA